VVPWFKSTFHRHGESVCRNRWIAIRHGDRVCYAQWSDCGPWVTDDAKYVFGDARPSNPNNDGAALDVAPAVRDFLGMRSGGRCDWRFVEEHEVPEGPWRSYGTNNPFSSDWKKEIDRSAPVVFTPKSSSMYNGGGSGKPKTGNLVVKGNTQAFGIPGLTLRKATKKS